MIPGPSISASVTVAPLGISFKHGLPFLEGPRLLAAIPPFPFSPVGFSAFIALLFLFFKTAKFPKLPYKSYINFPPNINYDLTPPAIIPSIICFSKIATNIIIGKSIIHPIALTKSHGTPYILSLKGS